MRQTVEMYIAFLMLILFMTLAMAFTSINLHVSHARSLFNSVKANIQASNGNFADLQSNDIYSVSFKDNGYKFSEDKFEVAYTVERVYNTSNEVVGDFHETWIYNDVYELNMVYVYNIPIFGLQVYPISGYVY